MNPIIRRSLVGITLCIWSITSSDVWACQPCPTPSAQLAFLQAYAVVVGKKVGSGPTLDQKTQKIKGENFTTIEVLQTLKGHVPEKQLKVKAYYGMCDYGLLLKDQKPHLIFLRRSFKGFETLLCKAKEYPVQDGKVEFEDDTLKLTELKKVFSPKKESE